MEPKTTSLWAQQDQHQGDRWRLFRAVAAATGADTVFYPGCYVDIAPSFVFGSVTYLDSDRRATGFFNDRAGIAEIIIQHDGPAAPDITFIAADYTDTLGLPDEHFDLLISLYAGFISEHCTRYLRIGGTLLVTPSHGDAALASIDSRYKLSGVVISRNGNYRVGSNHLDTYLISKKEQHVTVESLHQTGRGVAYTKSPFAYFFTRVA